MTRRNKDAMQTVNPTLMGGVSSAYMQMVNADLKPMIDALSSAAVGDVQNNSGNANANDNIRNSVINSSINMGCSDKAMAQLCNIVTEQMKQIVHLHNQVCSLYERLLERR